MTEEPGRWLDDASAPAELRADLRALRDAPPPDVDYTAGLAALEARIRGPSGPSGGAPPSGGSGGALGLATAISLAACLGGAAWWLSGSDATIVPPPGTDGAEVPPLLAERGHDETFVRSDEPARRGSDDERRALVADAEAPEPDPAPEPPRGEPGPAAAPRRPRLPAPSTAEEAAERPPAADLLRREMELVERARRALDRDPSAALAFMDTAQREVGRGTFGDEREAIRVLALFALGRDAQARPLAARLLARDPDGLYAARIRASIAEMRE